MKFSVSILAFFFSAAIAAPVEDLQARDELEARQFGGVCPPLFTANGTSEYLFRILTTVATSEASCGRTMHAGTSSRRATDQ